MRCLYCGKQLALFRRLTGSGEFCSDAHKKNYHEEYNRLALTRLIAAQNKPDEKRPLSPAPSTLQLAASVERSSTERKGTRQLEEPAQPAPDNRWSIPNRATPKRVSDSRMIEPPSIEASAPPSAPFLKTSLAGASSAPLPRPTEAAAEPIQLHPAGWCIKWSPPLRLADDPPAADCVPLLGIKTARIPQDALPGVLRPGSFSTHLATDLILDPRLGGRLRSRPAIALEAVQFAPELNARPEADRRFASHPFAVVLFGGPSLPVLGPLVGNGENREPRSSGHSLKVPLDSGLWGNFSNRTPTQSASPEVAFAPNGPGRSTIAENLQSRTFLQSLATLPVYPANVNEDAAVSVRTRSLRIVPQPSPASNGHSMEPAIFEDAKRPSDVKLRLAALGSTESDPLPLNLSEGAPPGARDFSEKPRPKLPTIPAARRKIPAPMNTVVQPAIEPEPDPAKSIWGTLRKYIKR